MACPMHLWNLHLSIVSEARNERVTFVIKPQQKIFSLKNGKHGYLMQCLIRQSFEGYCCESEYIFFFSKSRSDFRLNLLLLKGKGCVTAQLFLKNGKTLVCNAKTKLSCNREACTKTFCLVLEFGRKFRMHARQTGLGQLSL